MLDATNIPQVHIGPDRPGFLTHASGIETFDEAEVYEDAGDLDFTIFLRFDERQECSYTDPTAPAWIHREAHVQGARIGEMWMDRTATLAMLGQAELDRIEGEFSGAVE